MVCIQKVLYRQAGCSTLHTLMEETLNVPSHSASVQIGVPGIKRVNQCQTGRPAEIVYVDCSVSPGYEVKGVRSVSETAHKINYGWPG